MYTKGSAKAGYYLSNDPLLCSTIANNCLRKYHDIFKVILSDSKFLHGFDSSIVPSEIVGYFWTKCPEFVESLALLLFKKKYSKLNEKSLFRLAMILSNIANSLDKKNINFQVTLGLCLKHYGLNSTCEALLGKFGIISGNTTTIKYTDQLAYNHDKKFSHINESIVGYLIDSVLNSNLVRPKGFNLVMDNIDLSTTPRDISIVYDQAAHQLHYTASLLFSDVVTGEELNDNVTRTPLNEIPLNNLYKLTAEEKGHIFKYLHFHIKKTLNEHYPSIFKNDLVRNHYPHQFSSLFSKKIDQATGDFFFEDQSIEGLQRILSSIQDKYTVKTEEDGHVIYDNAFNIGGDQMTIARGSNLINSLVDHDDKDYKLSNLSMSHEYFHTEFAILNCFLKKLRHKDSLGIDGSFLRLSHELKREHCKTKDAQHIYYELSSLIKLIYKAMLAEILREMLKLESVGDLHNFSFKNKIEADVYVDQIIKSFFPYLKNSGRDARNLPKFHPLSKFVKDEVSTLNNFEDDTIINDDDGDVFEEDKNNQNDHCYVDSKEMEPDYLQNYYTNIFTLGSIFQIFNDSIKHGDGLSIYLLHKLLIRIFYSLGAKNYASLTANFIVKIEASFLPSESFRMLHNRFANPKGGLGQCTSHDFAMEHKIRFIKKHLHGLGPNINKKSITRINNSSDEIEKLIDGLLKDCKIRKRASKRTKKSLNADFIRLTEIFKRNNIAKYIPGRKFGEYKLKLDIFKDINDFEFRKYFKKKIHEIDSSNRKK